MCPVCKEPLVAFELEGVEVDHCVNCGGTWLDAGELELITELTGVNPGPLSKALGAGQARHGRRRCVRCVGRLRTVEVNSVEIDGCPRGHGFWFDRGEIRKLVSSFAEGEEGAVARFFEQLLRSELEPEGKG